MSTLFGKAKAFVVAHKAISTVIALVIVIGGYTVYKNASAGAATTSYILATAQKGTLISSVSGSGQVAAQNQVTITSLVPGTVNRVYVQDGDTVHAGQAIASIDAADAQRAVDNAELALENARVAYDKAVKDASDQAATSSISDLSKAYEAGYNAIVSTAIDLPAIFGGVGDIYYTPAHSPYFSDVNVSTQIGVAAADYKSQAGAAFDAARAEYNVNFLRYKNISESSSPAEIISLLNETDIILKKLLGALSGTYSTLDYIQNRLSPVPSQLTADKAAISADVAKINTDSTAISNALNSIDAAQTSGTTADLNMKAAQLTVNQDAAALSDAQTTLANHTITAPFDGIIAKVISKQGDIAANGTQVAIIVTEGQMVNISLNEVDAAKVAKGDKATLTFDAIDGLTLTGHVTNVDLVGTVSQGVVSYNVEIAFDATDLRVKPGMTANAEIITDVEQDALLVPSSAVKTQGTGRNAVSYVQVLGQKYSDAQAAAGVTSATAPQNIQVTVGDSNDTQVEITSGLSEGDQVISRTVVGAAKSSSAPSILSSFGGGARNGGANVRTGGAVRIGG